MPPFRIPRLFFSSAAGKNERIGFVGRDEIFSMTNAKPSAQTFGSRSER
ncbi:MAG: hypothetical protein AB1656_20055 [Candidatus Omnitrophota bacterium]